MNQRGFSQIILLGIVAVLVITGTGGFLLFKEKKIPSFNKTVQIPNPKTQPELRPDPAPLTRTPLTLALPSLSPSTSSSSMPSKQNSPPPKLSSQNPDQKNQQPPQTTKIELWKFDGMSWKPEGVAPVCPTLLLQSPVDLSKVTSILYPGQYRGGNYKPHGGFRFDTSKSSDITITVPLDAYLFRGSRYIESGEVQYLLDFMTPCGFAYRFDHILTLSSKYATIANQFPEPKVGDSRTTEVEPVSVKTGEVIATAIGLEKSPSTGVDWGVYDLRQMNQSAQDPTWRANHSEGQFGWYALCWFDWLTPSESLKVRGLPAGDSVNGKQSDYCK